MGATRAAGRRRRVVAACVLGAVALGCGTVRGVSALRDVDATLDRVTDVRLGGVRLDDVTSVEDMPAADVAALTLGALAGRLPLECDAIVRLENPAGNRATAELLRTRWTLRLEGRDVVGGTVNRRYSIAPGHAVEVPVHVALDLTDVLGRQLGPLLEVALALASDRGHRIDASLRLVPILDTPLGGVPMPPITIPLTPG